MIGEVNFSYREKIGSDRDFVVWDASSHPDCGAALAVRTQNVEFEALLTVDDL